MSDITNAMQIAVSGLQAQGTRIRVVSENIANANSTASSPTDLPYRRQVVTFRNEFDREMGANLVSVDRVHRDNGEFSRRYQPGHPSADPNGYVLYPNVNSLIEMTDLREAQRSYEANLNVINSARQVLQQTVELLRR